MGSKSGARPLRAGWVGLVAVLVLLVQAAPAVAGGTADQARGASAARSAPLGAGAGYGTPNGAARVATVQRRLRALGWRPGPIDGLFGPRTEAATRSFQAAAGLTPDGVVGVHTWRALADARRRPLRRGAGYASAAGSSRVRSLQRQLRRRGLRPGPVDGRFGPRTEAAVARLQQAQGLPAHGAVDGRVKRVLASPGEPSSRPVREDRGPRRRIKVGYVPVSGAAAPDGIGPGGADLPLALLVALMVLVAGLGAWLLIRLNAVHAGTTVPLADGVVAEGQGRSRAVGRFRGPVRTLVLGRRGLRRKPEARYLVTDPTKKAPIWVAQEEVTRLLAPRTEEAPEPASDEPAASELLALGYVCVPSTDGDDELRIQAASIESLCRQRGWQLVEVVRDVEGDQGRALERPGLVYALERIESGEASCLVVTQLERVSRSAADLGRILERLGQSDGKFVAIDLGLDTSSAQGQVATKALISVGAWERRRVADQTRKGLAAARARGATIGRPAMRDVPALKQRIVEMRAAGMTLRAIADQLNAEGVPTLRGGKEWRPSSVQAAAGYRRPSRSNGESRGRGARP